MEPACVRLTPRSPPDPTMPAQPRDPFSSMLDAVGSRRDEREAHVRLRPVGNPGYQVQFSPDAAKPASAEALHGLYDGAAAGEDGPLPLRPPTTTDATDIALELGLESAKSGEDLHRARRRFALANHPDRLDPSQRETATRRMMIANRLIDEALSRKA